MAAATKIVGEYIRSESALRHREKAIKKISVCGKGGAGKSTVTALLALSLCRLGYKPLVIDTDDSNEGTACKLGIEEQPLPLMDASSRFGMDPHADMSWLSKDPLHIEEIPAAYVAEADGVRFMRIGKIENPFQGCSCDLGEIVKRLMQNIELREGEMVIADQDAGTESFGRGVEQGSDTVLIVTEPSRDSLLLSAGRAHEIPV
ncbi:P-loop NTPase [Adlercreutzia sp. ZJ242]|uniref:nucleotide-binding protein n=1 Tax=Adlercreutzia sp. ZJ242 TaxID=2709409 RepID=UPI0013EABCBF|nr:P-loop NTPase [Adlercreutzia sp. ZJ242]